MPTGLLSLFVKEKIYVSTVKRVLKLQLELPILHGRTLVIDNRINQASRRP